MSCTLAVRQQAFYKEIINRSKKVWKDHLEDKKKKKGKGSELVLDLTQDEDSAPVKGKSISSLLNNTLMEMRKVTNPLERTADPAKMANHPLLCRNFFDDEKVTSMAKVLKECDEDYATEKLEHIAEVKWASSPLRTQQDLCCNSDFELHKLCLSNPFLESFQLPEGNGEVHLLFRPRQRGSSRPLGSSRRFRNSSLT